MYQKNNPWISLVALLLMVLIVVLNCTGCTSASWGGEEAAPGDGRRTVITDPGAVSRAVITEPTETTEAAAAPLLPGRFKVEYAGMGWPYLEGFYVITDSQTGVQYLLCETGQGIGLTKLEG